MRAVAVKVLLATILVVIAWSAVAVYRERAALNEPVDVSQAHFTGSQACVDCHADRHESWYATFHRTMTQEATPDSVQGRFDGQPLDYWGLRMRPVSEDGRYYFEYSEIDTGEVVDRREIVRTVGSHRYQQYMTYVPETGNYVRLHYLWHNGDQRWVHMNAAFLGPDEQDYSAQVSVWNQNCIFCHNTGPEPRMTNYDDLVRRARRARRSISAPSRCSNRAWRSWAFPAKPVMDPAASMSNAPARSSPVPRCASMADATRRS
ncbi:hypothetical protein [Pseudofulvimonas gallinarii]|uniref:hypothetical protein n=1 Tax=Pseudofulvimonas gallinarii TaxID=634155 RepID=UPI0013DDD581|nr:hypothetical protein [Pseudofulvimonas gallinarii]